MNTTTDPFPPVFAALLVAHYVGDYWLQTGHQAEHKGDRGLTGWLTCARHVASYTAATALLVAVVCVWRGFPVTPAGFITGQLVSAVSHLVIDRRYTLRWFIEHATPWNRKYYEAIPGGAEKLDQAAHLFFLLAAALVTAVVP